MILNRVLDPEPVLSLDDYVADGGGVGLDASITMSRAEVIDTIDRSGLRGRGGGGFPTAKKWQTISDFESAAMPTNVVVNGAEGEPGSFKDRTLLRTNPYRVIEGALVAAHAFGSSHVTIAVKSSFTDEIERLRAAVDEIVAAGWTADIDIEVFEGPSAYLYGEETGLLEALEGRPPFPRIAPPWRQGVVEIETIGDHDTSGEPSEVQLGTESLDSPVPPALINNVETFAHVAMILANGPEWFRECGTEGSPGTIVCTVTGSTRRHGVAEFELGTPLMEVIDTLGGGPIDGRQITAVLSGVSNALLLQDRLDTPLTHDAMDAAGTGLGATGFIVFDDRDDLVEVVRATMRFLSVESCGQCRPCKGDGLAMTDLLSSIEARTAGDSEWALMDQLRESVTTGARCFLATQQQNVTQDLRALAYLPRPEDPRPVEIAPIVDLHDEQAVLDSAQADKHPDWTFTGTDSGEPPVERLASASRR